MTTTRYYTIRDVADRLQVSPRTVRRWIAEGSLGAWRRGRIIRIPEGALTALLREG